MVFLKFLKIEKDKKLITTIYFKQGLNIIYGESVDKHGSNAVGKTLCIQLIEYCLQHDKPISSITRDETLKEHSVTLGIDQDTYKGSNKDHADYIITRYLNSSKRIIINGVEQNEKEDLKKYVHKIFLTDLYYTLDIKELLLFYLRLDKHSKNFENIARTIGITNKIYLSILHNSIAINQSQVLKINDKLKNELENKKLIEKWHKTQEAEAIEEQNINVKIKTLEQYIKDLSLIDIHGLLENRTDQLSKKIKAISRKINYKKLQLKNYYASINMYKKDSIGDKQITNIYMTIKGELPTLIKKDIKQILQVKEKLYENNQVFLSNDIQKLHNDIVQQEIILNNYLQEQEMVIKDKLDNQLINLSKVCEDLVKYKITQSKSDDYKDQILDIKDKINHLKNKRHELYDQISEDGLKKITAAFNTSLLEYLKEINSIDNINVRDNYFKIYKAQRVFS